MSMNNVLEDNYTFVSIYHYRTNKTFHKGQNDSVAVRATMAAIDNASIVTLLLHVCTQ